MQSFVDIVKLITDHFGEASQSPLGLVAFLILIASVPLIVSLFFAKNKTKSPPQKSKIDFLIFISCLIFFTIVIVIMILPTRVDHYEPRVIAAVATPTVPTIISPTTSDVSAINIVSNPFISIDSKHEAGITSIALSSNENFLVSGDQNGTLKLWDVSQRQNGVIKQLSEIKTQAGAVQFISFKPNDNIFATAGEDKIIKLWEIQPINKSLNNYNTLIGHTGPVLSLDFSPDGRFLISSGGDNDGSIRIWNTSTGKGLQTIKGTGASVNSVVFNHSGDSFATANLDGSLKIWEFNPNNYNVTQLHSLAAHNDKAVCVRFSPNDTILASSSYDKNINFWNPKNGNMLKTLKGNNDLVLSLTFSPNTNAIASSSQDGTIRVWLLDQSQTQPSFTFNTHIGPVYAITFMSDSKTLISAGSDKSIRFWHI